MPVKTAGRTDVDAYFRQSGVLTSRTLPHTPFLVFMETPQGAEVQLLTARSNCSPIPTKRKSWDNGEASGAATSFSLALGRRGPLCTRWVLPREK